METIIPCPFCRTKVAVGSICGKCGVGIPGDGPIVTKPFAMKFRPRKERRPIHNQIRIS